MKLSTAMEEGRKIDLQLKTVLEAKRDIERKIVYNEKLSQTLSEDLVREKRDRSPSRTSLRPCVMKILSSRAA